MKLSDLFESFDPKPIAAASIAQVQTVDLPRSVGGSLLLFCSLGRDELKKLLIYNDLYLHRFQGNAGKFGPNLNMMRHVFPSSAKLWFEVHAARLRSGELCAWTLGFCCLVKAGQGKHLQVYELLSNLNIKFLSLGFVSQDLDLQAWPPPRPV